MKWFKADDGEFHAVNDDGTSLDGFAVPDGADLVDEVPADGISNIASREAIDALNPAGYTPYPEEIVADQP
jgi:hypothetical protein